MPLIRQIQVDKTILAGGGLQYKLQYNITLLPSVNTLIAREMFCGAKYTHHTFTPIIKHLITPTANKHPGKKSFIDTEKHEKIPLADVHTT